MKSPARVILAFTILLLAALPLGAQPLPPETGQTFAGPGGNLYYEIHGGGSATPLVLVNGGPGFDHRYLHVSNVWETLAKSRPVVFYDQRGNGRSDALKSGQASTLADQIADLDALRAHLGYAQMDLLGHSWGGYLVMAYTAQHPEHVRRLIICDSAAPKWSDTLFLFKEVFPEGVAREDALDFADKMGDLKATEEGLHEYLAMLFYSPEKRDAFMVNAAQFRYTRDVNEKVNADLARFDLNPELPKFRMPTLVLSGRFDMNVAPLTAWKIHHAIAGSEFHVFERSGHLPWYEEPEEFLRIVQPFLAR
jgi:proline iminopeptidase